MNSGKLFVWLIDAADVPAARISRDLSRFGLLAPGADLRPWADEIAAALGQLTPCDDEMVVSRLEIRVLPEGLTGGLVSIWYEPGATHEHWTLWNGVPTLVIPKRKEEEEEQS